MHIFFGPEQDRLNVTPSVSGSYEWWYFDALSADGRYALVVIYFLGSPMSPYYKAVVDGKRPDARDWCGVFVSLHERRRNHWTERAYAYNLYRGGTFSYEHVSVTVGSSRLEGEPLSDERFRWQLSLNERGLWRGAVQGDLAFTTSSLPVKGLPVIVPQAPDAIDVHVWVCSAPDCDVAGTITLPDGNPVRFTGTGYHDHNYGILPWAGIDSWYWARARFAGPEGKIYAGVCYDLEHTDGTAQVTTLLWQGSRIVERESGDATNRTLSGDVRNAYGLRHVTTLRTENSAKDSTSETAFHLTEGLLTEGPFYRRVPVTMTVQQSELAATGHGIGEIFRPARLCGPIAARAMWTRMRRR